MGLRIPVQASTRHTFVSKIIQVVERVHAVLHAEGTVRLITVVKLETRTDKVPTLAGKRL